MNLSYRNLSIISVVVIMAIGVIETVVKAGSDGNLLLLISFWITLIQGPVAVAAAAEVSRGKWAQPMKTELLAFYPLILFIALLFLFISFQMDIYEWTEIHHRWLNKSFFITRHFVLLILSFFVAHLFARASLLQKKSSQLLAVLYLFIFVISQSVIAIDWIMSLEYPWMSTMFPAIYFMESFYGGLAILALMAVVKLRQKLENGAEVKKVIRDAALFMFGFALAWAGLYYGQFLVIWYGNIPWETSFFGIRMDHSPFKEMMTLIIIILFIIPFVGLISRKAKESIAVVSFVSILVLIGLLIERLFYILPVLSLNALWIVIEFILMSGIFWLFFKNHEQVLRINK